MDKQVTSGQNLQTITEMEAKPNTSSSQKYEYGDGDTDWPATLALSYLSENNLQSDAVLSLEDGGTIPVNRETLTKYSEYFRTIFTTKLYSPEKTEFFPPGVSTKIMTQIRDYAYYRTVDIDEDNVCQLLQTSDYLCVPDIVQRCCDFLKYNLDPENCIGVMRYASWQLESDARCYLMRHFVKVSQQSEELLELPLEELQEIVGADELNVKNERIVWECVLHWIDHDTDNRKGHIVDLLKNIRLGLLDRNFLMEKIMCHPHVAGDEVSRLVITEVLTYLDELETMTTRHEEIPTPKFALPRVHHDVLFVIGGTDKHFRSIDYIETYSARTDRWTKIEAVDICCLRGQCAAAIGFDIYVTCGIENGRRSKSCRCFNAVTKTWRDVAPMKYYRFCPCVAVLGDVLYVMGGWDGNSRLKTAERYDPKTDRWSPIADMNVERSTANATELNGKVYVVGGWGNDVSRWYDNGSPLRSAEVYDPLTNQWSLISDMRIGRKSFSCIAFHGCVYAIGHFDFEDRSSMRSGEKYDPLTDTWSPIPDMITGRCDLAIAVFDDKLYAIGGSSALSGYTNRVEYFNEGENEWHEATGISEARENHCAVVVSGLPNVNDYIGRRIRQE
jgi:kelch-like protein 10